MQLSRALIAFALSLLAGVCAAQGDGSSVNTTPPGAQDPDTLFKGRMGGTFGEDITKVMPRAKRIAVAGFRVGFVVENKVSAQVRASYLPGGIDRSGAHSSFHVKMQGVSAQAMQQITDAAYAALVKELEAAGREVVPLAELKEHYAGMQLSQNGMTKELNGQTAVFFTPTGMPLAFMMHDGQWNGMSFDLTNYRKLEEMSARTNAAVITPLIIVNFARMSSSGNRSGLMANSAETGGELGMSVQAMQVFYTRASEFRNGMQMGGDQGSFKLETPIMGGNQFGTMQVAAQDNNAGTKLAFDLLGKRMGMANAGGAARSSTSALAQVNEQAYAGAAGDVLQRMASGMGAWFRKYPAAAAAATTQ